MNNNRKGQAGFTLLELIVVTVIIAILVTLGITSFWVYRSDAAYTVAETVMRNSRVAIEASLNDLDHPPGVVNFSQAVSGPISDVSARLYLPAMDVPRNIKLSAQYDPSCTLAGCQSDFVEVKHCLGREYMQWVRFGDGAEANLTHISGAGCQ